MEKSFELWRTITPKQRNWWWREPCSAGDCSRCYGLSRHSQVTPRVALPRAKKRRRAAAFHSPSAFGRNQPEGWPLQNGGPTHLRRFTIHDYLIIT